MDASTMVFLAVLIARLCGCRDWKSQALLTALILVPDIDGAARWLDAPMKMVWPYALLHGVAGLLVIALLAGSLHVMGWRRLQTRWVAAILLAMVAHGLADILTEQGVTLWWPLGTIPTHLDVMPSPDPIIWAIGTFLVAVPVIANLVSGEIGAKKREGSGSAWVALVLLLGYVGYRTSQHDEAVARLMALSFDNAASRRAEAYPVGLSWTRWRAIADNGDGYYIREISLSEAIVPAQFRRVPKPDVSAAIRAVASDELVRAMLRQAHFPLWSESPLTVPVRATGIELRDARLSLPPSSRSVVQCRVFLNGQLDSCEYLEK